MASAPRLTDGSAVWGAAVTLQGPAAISDNFQYHALTKLTFEFFQFNCKFLSAVFLDDLRFGDVLAYCAVKCLDALPHADIYEGGVKRVADAECVKLGIIVEGRTSIFVRISRNKPAPLPMVICSSAL